MRCDVSWYSNAFPSRLEVAGMLAGRQPRGMFGGDLLALLITGVPTRDRVFLGIRPTCSSAAQQNDWSTNLMVEESVGGFLEFSYTGRARKGLLTERPDSRGPEPRPVPVA